MSPAVAGPLFLVSLGVTLMAARLFAERLDRVGTRFGLSEAVVGLLTAFAADGPEITSALVALIKGAHGVSVGVLVGSNVFNIAAMIGVSALLFGSVILPSGVLLLEGLVGGLVTVIASALLLGWIGAVPTLIVLAGLLAVYVLLLLRGPGPLARLHVASRIAERLRRIASERRSPAAAHPSAASLRRLAALIVLDVVLIVLGSTGMVEAAISLGKHWHISGAVLGVLILAPLTSIPNALTGVRLGRERRGSALISETFNSNTINLVAGVAIPALFVTVAATTNKGKADVAWLVGMTLASLLLLSRPAGLRRGGAIVLIGIYAGFVVTHLT